jgi:hypothetical protein
MQYNQWSTEVAGAIANYNNLVGEYNANMKKTNWFFCNANNLSPGETPLPQFYAELNVEN